MPGQRRCGGALYYLMIGWLGGRPVTVAACCVGSDWPLSPVADWPLSPVAVAG